MGFDVTYVAQQALTKTEDRLTVVRHQPERALILETLAEARKCDVPVADRPGLGRLALSVPLEDMERLAAKYPDLRAKDQQIRSKAWQRFIQSAESHPFRWRERI